MARAEIDAAGRGNDARLLETPNGGPADTDVTRWVQDRGDGNLLRAQTAAAGITVNAQLRADETRLRHKPQGDVLERLLKTIEEERARINARRAAAESLPQGKGEEDIPAVPDDAGEAF